MDENGAKQVYEFIQAHLPMLKEKVKTALNGYIDKYVDKIYEDSKSRIIYHVQNGYGENFDFPKPLENKVDMNVLNDSIANLFNLQDGEDVSYMWRMPDDYAAAFCGLDDIVYLSMLVLADSIIEPQSEGFSDR